MYARRIDTKVIGDVNYMSSGIVRGVLHSGRPFRWRLGRGKIELIEHGSFNPKNPNFVQDGKVVRVS